MEPDKLKANKRVLEQNLPQNAFLFKDDLLLVAAKTNSGKIYTVWIELCDNPKAGVTKVLKDKKGKKLDCCSGAMHTLSSRHGGTTICYGEWSPMTSLYKIYIKCRLWLEMYELHLETGYFIDHYLKHVG